MRLCLFLLLATTLHAQKPTQADVAYGDHPRQKLDLYQAKADQPTPVLFFIHGGGWMNGDKAMPDFLDQCLGAGISVVSINYRLIPDALEAKIDPPVKACLDDAARALQFVRSQASAWHLDPQRIAGCGGSAGGFNCLWLAFHPDLAQPQSQDPIARESTRLRCVLAFVPQTSLDPKQMLAWIPNNEYGHHAFALPSMDDFLARRDSLMPWIEKFSPFLLASEDDPPVYLFYDSVAVPGQPAKDPPHSANYGTGLAAKLERLKVPFELNTPDAGHLKYPDMFSFLVEHLQKAAPAKP